MSKYNSFPSVWRGLTEHRREHPVYNRARTTKKKEDWAAYKKLKKDNQRERRRSYSSHVSNLMSDEQTGNPKKLYSFIKSKKCDASGVAPLTSNGLNHSNSVKTANILNDQFTVKGVTCSGYEKVTSLSAFLV